MTCVTQNRNDLSFFTFPAPFITSHKTPKKPKKDPSRINSHTNWTLKIPSITVPQLHQLFFFWSVPDQKNRWRYPTTPKLPVTIYPIRSSVIHPIRRLTSAAHINQPILRWTVPCQTQHNRSTVQQRLITLSLGHQLTSVPIWIPSISYKVLTNHHPSNAVRTDGN